MNHALAINENNQQLIANASVNVSALNHTRLNETDIETYSIFNVTLDLIIIFQILIQTFCTLILTTKDLFLQMGLCQKRVVALMLSYIMFCNLAIWGSFSFIEAGHGEHKVSLYVITEIILSGFNWKIVSTFLYPLVLFYRFHSSKLMLISLIGISSAGNRLQKMDNKCSLELMNLGNDFCVQ